MQNNLDITIYDFENICRTCLSPDDLKPLYEKWLQSTSLVDMLMSCTVLEFTEDDGLPVKICLNFINQITQAFLFAQRCEATDTILRKCEKKINTKFACNSFQAKNILPKQEIKIKVEPEITDGTVRDVVGDYNIKEEEDMKREFTSEIILPTEEKILDDLEQVEEVTQEDNLNIDYEKTFHDPMVENDQDATYSKKSDIPSSWPQIEKYTRSSKDEDSETCDKPADESYVMDDDDDDQDEPKIYAGLYACHVCRESFNNSSNLEVHKLIHSSEKPHVCSVCSKAFKIKTNLKTHMRIHSGEKTYKCEVCSKAFIRVDNLKEHMRKHTGEKPYTCEVCSKAFTHNSSLKTHMRQHTG